MNRDLTEGEKQFLQEYPDKILLGPDPQCKHYMSIVRFLIFLFGGVLGLLVALLAPDVMNFIYRFLLGFSIFTIVVLASFLIWGIVQIIRNPY